MEVEVVARKENALLDRIEIRFRIAHQTKSTPSRKEVKEAIAQMEKVGRELVIIDWMDSQYGTGVSSGFAKVYASKDLAMTLESKHILIRNGLLQAEKKEAKAPKEKPAAEEKEKAEKKEEKKEEKKVEGEAKGKEKKEEKAEKKEEKKGEEKRPEAEKGAKKAEKKEEKGEKKEDKKEEKKTEKKEEKK